MATYQIPKSFYADFQKLCEADRAAFRSAVALFRAGLTSGSFAPQLRVKRFKSMAGVWELSWSARGRALFRFAPPLPGRHEHHIVWLVICKHDALDRM
jgi:hypothetical protein